MKNAKASAKAVRRGSKLPVTKRDKPMLLSGGNPQIAKADGDAPVQAYIDGMPGWKRDMGLRVDAIITQAVPGVRKAVKWNSPFYGVADPAGGWFLGIHCFAKYIKVAFFRGAELRPPPPVASKQKDVRYLHIHEGDELDGDQLASWIRQAASMKPSGDSEAKAGGKPERAATAAGKVPSTRNKVGVDVHEKADWRAETIARVRAIIMKAVPDAVEEVKWRKASNPAGVPVWSNAGGIICTGETYKNAVKLTFAKGAAIEDPSGLFNSSLEGNTRRAIDIQEGDVIDEKGLKALVRAAAALNGE